MQFIWSAISAKLHALSMNEAKRATWVLLALGGVVLFVAAYFSPLQNLNDKLRDQQWRFLRATQLKPAVNEPVVVGIDEAFLDQAAEPLVLSHRYLAEFLLILREAGAKVVALDLSLPEKRFDQITSSQQAGSDFHQSLLQGLLQSQAGLPIVAAKIWDQQQRRFRSPHLDYQAVLSLQNTSWQALASAELCRDADQLVRRFPGADCQPDGQAFGLASEVVAAAGQRQNWHGLINYQLGPAFNYLPLQSVLQLNAEGKSQQLRALFGGRVVLLGVILEATDLLDTPVPLAAWLGDDTRVPGVLVHAQLIRSMMNQSLIQAVPASGYGFVILLFCLVLQAPLRLSLAQRMSVLLVLLVVAGLVSTYALHTGWDWPLAQVLFAGGCLLLLKTSWQALLSFIDRQRLARAFSGRVSPVVLHSIFNGELEQVQRSQRRAICVLFSDVRGFTSRCEHSQPEDIVALLNRYFARMSAIVHQHGGTIDKFIGDGLMAFFGAPNRLKQPEMAALQAALAMRAALVELNQELIAEGQETLQIGIGLHSGVAVIGQLGSAERHEYTAIGDTVNTCARIEGLCKNMHQDLLCTQAVIDNLPEDAASQLASQFMDLGEQALKGRAALSVYAVLPLSPESV